MRCSQVAEAREMNRAPGLYGMTSMGALSNSMCGFSLLWCVYMHSGEDNTCTWCENGWIHQRELNGKVLQKNKEQNCSYNVELELPLIKALPSQHEYKL